MSTEPPIFQAHEREIFHAESCELFDSQLERSSNEPHFHPSPEIDAPLFESQFTKTAESDTSQSPNHD